MICCPIHTWNCAPDGTEVLVIHDLEAGTIEYRNKDLSVYTGDETELELCDKPCCLITVALVDEDGNPVTSVFNPATGEQTCYDENWAILDPCPDLFAPAGGDSDLTGCCVSEVFVDGAGNAVTVVFDPATGDRSCYDSQFNELDPCPALFAPGGGGGGGNICGTMSITQTANGFDWSYDCNDGSTPDGGSIAIAGGGGGTVSTWTYSSTTLGNGDIEITLAHNDNNGSSSTDTFTIPSLCSMIGDLAAGPTTIAEDLVGVAADGSCRRFPASGFLGGGTTVDVCDEISAFGDGTTATQLVGLNAAGDCELYDAADFQGGGGNVDWDCETDLAAIPEGTAAKVLGVSAGGQCVMSPLASVSDIQNLCTLLNAMAPAGANTTIEWNVAIDTNGNCVLNPDKVSINANGAAPGGDAQNSGAWDSVMAQENPASYPLGTDICVTNVEGFGTLFGKRGTDGQGNPQWTLFQGVI